MQILGIDEVGRGPWAGPLVVGAVILGKTTLVLESDWYQALTDSKILSAKRRQELSSQIFSHAVYASLGWVSAVEIDHLGLSASLKLATKRALLNLRFNPQTFSEIIIDGTVNFLDYTKLSSKVTLLKKADSLIKEVSAASIIAKVARDQYMINIAEKYPNYGFEKHVGYGTKFHQSALLNFGPTPEHRHSFRPIANLVSTSANSKTKTLAPNSGQIAETKVSEFLLNSGHQIIARNHRTRFYEIDIISIFQQKIYFTEVKYRKNSDHGSPLEFITKSKQQQMHFAAESFLKFQNLKLQPVLAVASVSRAFQIDDFFVLD